MFLFYKNKKEWENKREKMIMKEIKNKLKKKNKKENRIR